MKRKTKKFFRILFLLFILAIVILGIYYLFVFVLLNKEDKVKPEFSAVITTGKEENSDLVKEYFVKGMDANNYIKTIEQKSNYIESKDKYTKINYNFEKHLHYEELESIYKKLNNSDIVKLEVIGKSVDNRNIYSIEIGAGTNKTLFEAGIHAAEMANPLFITKYMVDIVNSYENGDTDTISILNEYKIVVLPVANPDGYETAVFGPNVLNNKNLFVAKNATLEDLEIFKGNANGIDLNRNFPSQTAGLYYNLYELHDSVSLKPKLASYSYFPGYTLGSEPETKAIIYFQNKHFTNMNSYVALHSMGRVIYNGKPYLSDAYNNNSYECASIISDITGYDALNKSYEEAGMGNDGTSSEYLAEVINGFIFSSATGRLTRLNYMEKITDTISNACVIVIESLDGYTTDLNRIKDEYYNYNLSNSYTEIIKRKL